jgi:predicted TIM-barrel fold metal-dependent hydrolase
MQEAADVWTNRLSRARFGDDIPHVGEGPEGSQWWVIAGKPAAPGRYQLGSVAAAIEPRNRVPRRWEDIPPCTYVPAERLKAMDRDEVDTHTFFPNIAGVTNNLFQKEGSEEFRLECIRAYNDWLADEWTAFSPRFISQCVVPMWNSDLAAAEIVRAVKRGHRGVIWHGATEVLGLPHFNERIWDPVYQTCADLGVPLCLHLGAVPYLPAWEGYGANTASAVRSTRSITANMQAITNVLFSGVMDRFPDLKLIAVESGIGWIPYLLEICDHEYDNLGVAKEGLKSRPSESFRRQMWATFWFERMGMLNREHIGVENILYETDFPHPTSTWPNSKRCREESLEGVPIEERRLMLMGNAIKLYHLDVDASALDDDRVEAASPTPSA